MRRIGLLLLPVCFAVLALLVVALVPASPRAPALIYMRYTRRTDVSRTSLYRLEAAIEWRDLTSKRSRQVAATEPSTSGDTGFLPAPNGAWLLAWGGDLAAIDKRGDAPVLLRMIRLPDRKTIALGHYLTLEADFLPYWRGDHQLLFEGERTRAVFDVRATKLSGRLPRAKEGGDPDKQQQADTARLVAYCRGHYPKEVRTLRQAYPLLADRMDLHRWASQHPSEPLEFLFARTLGLPIRELLQPASFTTPRGADQSPSAAPSPDGSRVACAFADHYVPVKQWQDFYHADARLAVFEVHSGKKVWETTLPARPWNAHGQMTWTFVPPPWNAPEFTHPRWSPDGRYLSFTTCGEEGGAELSVTVMDTRTWKRVLHISDASDAFFIPSPAE